MQFKLPFIEVTSKNKEKAVEPVTQNPSKLAKAFKIRAFAMGQNTSLLSNYARSNFESPPHDFSRIMEAIDTDSYLKQGMAMYRELMWKSGWNLVSENPDAVDYVWQRIAYLELAMNRSFYDFLVEVADQLVKFHNVFIAKSRSPKINSAFPGRLKGANGQDPILGYYLIPVETVEIRRDKHNNVKQFRQKKDPTTISDADNFPVWDVSEVIHLHRDRKTGRAFGTPFLLPVLEDCQIVRQIEEDIANLIHRELFPLYKYHVGDPENPASPEELDKAAAELENLRVEGGLILPFNHDVDVIGGQGAALDAAPYLTEFKHRLAKGIGVYPHHLGMTGGGAANKAATDRLDVALYDRVKEYQRYLEQQIRIFILNELLVEGGFNPFEFSEARGPSDVVQFKFDEIDLESQIKAENHEIQKMTANVKTIPETRVKLGDKPEYEETETLMGKTFQQTLDQIEHTAAFTPKPTTTASSGSSGSGTAKKSSAAPRAAAANPSPKGSRNEKNVHRGVDNKSAPQNQHGRRMAPIIRHIDEDWLNVVESLLDENEEL